MQPLKKIAAIWLLLMPAAAAYAQECLDQTPEQKAVVGKAVAVARAQFATLKSLGWLITENYTGEQSPVAKKPAPFRPLMLCGPLYNVTLTADPATAFGKMLQDSSDYYTAQAQKNKFGDDGWVRATKNMARIATMQTIQITVTENTPYLVYGEPKGDGDKNIVLHLKGAGFAYRQYVAPADTYSIPDETTWVYIGNWAGIKELKDNYGYVSYPFIHKQLSPFIETLDIKIHAPAQIADAITSKIDWDAFNGALSR